MDLKDTASLMSSEDYKERFKAEYFQTKIRYEKLHKTIVKFDAGTLKFQLSCPMDVLRHQKDLMGSYLNILEIRAEIEGINLEEV